MLFAAGSTIVPSFVKNHLQVWIDKGYYKREIYYDKATTVMVDSGAFSAYTKGKKVNRDEYCEFIINYRKKWLGKLKELTFINLDVIGNPKETIINQKFFDDNNYNVLPVVHLAGFKEKRLEECVEKYPYICLGGMVGRKTKKHTIPWLNKCFSIIGKYYKKTNKMPKIHLLGMFNPSILYRYPAYSCDSTSWLKVRKFGFKPLKIPKVPAHSQNRELSLQLENVLIKEYLDEEKKITKFWKKKGISWND